MTSERRRTALVLALAAAVITADQVTKTFAVNGLELGRPIHLVWTLQLNLTYNPGGAFSIGSSYSPFFAVAAVVVVTFLLASSRRALTAPVAVALGLVIGGATGNLADRLFRANGGAVIDFFDVQWWPVFNVADIALSGGAILLIVGSVLDERRLRRESLEIPSAEGA